MHQQLKERQAEARNLEAVRRKYLLEKKRIELEAKIAAIRKEYQEELDKLETELLREDSLITASEKTLMEMATRRNYPESTN